MDWLPSRVFINGNRQALLDALAGIVASLEEPGALAWSDD